jgi:hypothetical protein
MNRLKPLLQLACVLMVPLAVGCGDACLKLADQICNCQPDDASRSACQAQVRQQENVFPIRSEDQQRCQQALDSNACDCQKLTTPEGRQACGLAYTVAPPGTAAQPQ